MQGVARDGNAIGYAGLAYDKIQGIKTVSINGIAPPLDIASDHPYLRPYYYFIRADASPAAKEFIEWVEQSEEAKALVRMVGFLAAKLGG